MKYIIKGHFDTIEKSEAAAKRIKEMVEELDSIYIVRVHPQPEFRYSIPYYRKHTVKAHLPRRLAREQDMEYPHYPPLNETLNGRPWQFKTREYAEHDYKNEFALDIFADFESREKIAALLHNGGGYDVSMRPQD